MAKEYDYIKELQKLLGIPIENICISFFDDFIQNNADFRTRAGLKEYIIRTELANCCDWCHDLAGVYEYTPTMDTEVFRKHDRCKCLVTHSTKKGTFRDVWTKKEFSTLSKARSSRLEEIQNKISNSSLVRKLAYASNNKIKWPPVGNRISNDEYKKIRSYAESKGITLRKVKKSDVDLELLKEAIDEMHILSEKYPKLKNRIVIELSKLIDSNDFAITKNHVITLNANAVRNKRKLEEEYKKLVEEKHFVHGTNYLGIFRHEIGHTVCDLYDIDSLAIAKKVLKTDNVTYILEYCKTNLSEYAGSFNNGCEIISECFSAYYSGVRTPFVVDFLNECDKIIKSKK